MTDRDIPALDAAGLRRFALTTAAIVAALFGLLLPWLGGFGWPLWPWALAAVLALWGLIRPAGLRPVYRGWMRFGLLASRITTPLILGLVFFLLFVPMGLVMRLAGHDPMRRKLDPQAATYRVPSRPLPRRSVEKPY
ncbi:SxtJ family membrane protein [uncultured Thiohalocapsa sp.]|jgi:Cation transport ATPase|uniref:SxtJ family membrane protein n=1 Tax=uncultured Thiohalocapsa sp. TaxID=768990 RepID=UPI00014A2C6F|nr:SxtJ family membrane protein [uncultured Thiohalocapsa sp.]